MLMELAQGRYSSEYDDAPWKDPGHPVGWETSDLYRMRFPDAPANQETFDQYRRVEPASR
ncbi:MAG: hypothetical protein Q8L14_38105 [Myxococcales bacterium]|nr:hypothetical protein [Myxococcales bacterium]